MLSDDVIRFRAKHGIRQMEMAKLVGVTQQTLCAIEKGKTPSKFTEAKIRIFMEEYDGTELLRENSKDTE